MKKITGTKIVKLPALIMAGAAVAFTGCSKSSTTSSSDSGTTVSSLSSIPNLSSMVQSNSSSSSARTALAKALVSSKAGAAASVSGTAPLISSLKDGASDYFWNGSLSCSNDQARQNFWEGMGKCRMAQGVGEAFGRLLEAGTSMCYMKNIPNKGGSAITVTKGSVAAADLFKAQAADVMYKITTTGDPNMNEEIFIKTFGTDTIGAGNYKVQLYFCRNGASAAPSGHELIEFNKATGRMTLSHSMNEAQDDKTITGSVDVGAYLKESAGSIVIDSSKDRTMSAHFGGWGGVFKSDLTIDGSNEIRNKTYGSFTWTGGGQTVTGTNREYTVSQFSGSSISDLRFLAAGFKNQHSNTFGGQTYSHSGSGATEWQDTYYASAVSSSLQTEAEEADFSADTFYSSNLSAPSVDLSAYSCGATADVELTLDMSGAGMAAISAACESERFEAYDMCSSNTIRQAEQSCHGGS